MVNEHNALVPAIGGWKTGRRRRSSTSTPASAGRLSATGLHDARRRCRGRQPFQRLPRAQSSRIDQAHNSKPSLKGKGFDQPLRAPRTLARGHLVHQHHRHVLLSLLPPGRLSRFIVHWEIRESMTEAKSRRSSSEPASNSPTPSPRIISDNGPQFIAKDFKEFIRICGMTHVRTSPYYPQSNGKIERWHKTLKGECIRVKTPLSLVDARRVVLDFVAHYNEVRLHGAIEYVTPATKLAGGERDFRRARSQARRGKREEESCSRGESNRDMIADGPLPEPSGGTTMNNGLGGG